MAQQQLAKEQSSLGDLFSDLAAQTGTLIRQEASLAKAEFTEKAVHAGKDIGLIAAGGLVGYAGLLAVAASAIILVSYVIPIWTAALLVGSILGVTAYLMVSSGLAQLKKSNWAPAETIGSIKEDAQWLKNQMD